MNRLTLTLAIGLCGVAFAGPVDAAGTITGISVNPEVVTIGNAVSISIEGTGTCSLTFDYGDGDSDFFSNAAMPRTANHVYDTVGTKHVVVTAPDCPLNGKNEAEVRVRYKVAAAGSTDRTLTPLIPWITGVLGWGVQPGTPLIIGGLKFGTQEGTVRILGTDGAFKLLEILEWYDDGVGGMVPEDINDICVTGVQVFDANGVASHVKTLNVPLAFKLLPMADVTIVRCDQDGDRNGCNGVDFETEDIFECVEANHMPFGPNVALNTNLGQYTEGGIAAHSITGGHSNCWGAWADDSGHDVYRISLKNGWVLDSAHFVSVFESGEASTDPSSGHVPAGFVEGATSWEPRINWTVTAADNVFYAIDITIRGPACASHK